MTILGPKLLSSETREGFLGNTIDTIFWQVNHLFVQLMESSSTCRIQAAGISERWWRCYGTACEADGSKGQAPETEEVDWGDGPMNVLTVVGMMADGADVKEGTGRLGSACPLHASSAPSEVVVGGAGARARLRGEERSPVQGNKPMNTLWAVLTILAGAPFLNMPHGSSIKRLVMWVRFALPLAAGANIPCDICGMVNGWKWGQKRNKTWKITSHGEDNGAGAEPANKNPPSIISNYSCCGGVTSHYV